MENYVSIAPLWRGTNTNGGQDSLDPGLRDLIAGVCAACLQMGSDSDFILTMNEGGTPYMPRGKYTNIVTRYDDTIAPYTSPESPVMPDMISAPARRMSFHLPEKTRIFVVVRGT